MFNIRNVCEESRTWSPILVQKTNRVFVSIKNIDLGNVERLKEMGIKFNEPFDIVWVQKELGGG